MNYFKDNAQTFSLRETRGPNNGLRRGQIGSLHAIAAHFTERNDPAIISLPTGYGKTAVMAGACFLLGAVRILIIVPSIALRSQTKRNFKSLDTLRRLNVIPSSEVLASPVVKAIDKKMEDTEDWQKLTDADIVIAIPTSVSSAYEGIVDPPHGFFDLIIFDEGHHSPAKTWSNIINRIPNAKHILFTATPFRKDHLQLPGHLAYFYPLKNAVEEHAFGKVKYIPVTLTDHLNMDERDKKLSEKAAEIYKEDKDNGYEHRLLIRTDRINKVERLVKMYTEEGLKVKGVASRLHQTDVKDIEEKLLSGDLDGVVCVNMFGEGYDFPKFKIAVLHAPHKSLVPTLQFIGRFARTNDEKTGDASFIAVPGAVNSESSELYKEGVDWDILLSDITQAKQQLTLKERETLASFKKTANPSADYESVNPAQIRFPQHIAAFRTDETPKFDIIPDSICVLQVTNSWLSDDNSTLIIIAKDVNAPLWYRSEQLIDAKHECFLIKYFETTGIIFITATRRNAIYYSDIIKKFFNGKASKLPFQSIRKVLNNLQEQEFFSVGLRNISPSPTTETYRIVAGSQADRGIRDSDAPYFCQGHFFGKGEENGQSEIIGASSGGIVWSNGKIAISEMLKWMDTLHKRISSSQTNIGKSGLNKISFGEALVKIPFDTVFAEWGKECYRINPVVVWKTGSTRIRGNMRELDIKNITVAQDGNSLTFELSNDQNTRSIKFEPHSTPHYKWNGNGTDLFVEHKGGEEISICDWLDENNLTFYTSQLSSFSGTTINKMPQNNSIDVSNVETIDWGDCLIQEEFDYNDEDRKTVQKYLQDLLIQMKDLVFIIYDHRSGEAADFIVAHKKDTEKVKISLYHCKAAGGPISGVRVGDIYEIAGQAVKSVRFQKKSELLDHIKARTEVNSSGNFSKFIFGCRDDALEFLEEVDPIDLTMRIVAVQPGLSKASLNNNIKSIMAAANDSIISRQCEIIWLFNK